MHSRLFRNGLRRSAWVLGLCLALGLAFSGAGVGAQPPPGGGAPGKAGAVGKPGKADKPGGDKAGAPHAMSAEEHAAMEAMKKAATPGPEHQKLEGMVGKWKTTFTGNMGGDPAQVMRSEGTVEGKMILGGRYLQQTYKQQMMGQPMDGIATTGYDNLGKKYVSTWIDNMSTAIMYSEGTMDAGGQVLTMTSNEMIDPMTNKSMKMRSIERFESPDRHVMEMWGPGPDGKDMKMFEVVFTKVK